jgi:hypothetical protein
MTWRLSDGRSTAWLDDCLLGDSRGGLHWLSQEGGTVSKRIPFVVTWDQETNVFTVEPEAACEVYFGKDRVQETEADWETYEANAELVDDVADELEVALNNWNLAKIPKTITIELDEDVARQYLNSEEHYGSYSAFVIDVRRLADAIKKALDAKDAQ